MSPPEKTPDRLTSHDVAPEIAKPPYDELIGITTNADMLTDKYIAKLVTMLQNATGGGVRIERLAHNQFEIDITGYKDNGYLSWRGVVGPGDQILIARSTHTIKVVKADALPPSADTYRLPQFGTGVIDRLEQRVAQLEEEPTRLYGSHEDRFRALEARVGVLEHNVIHLLLSPPQARDGLVSEEEFKHETYRLSQLLDEQDKHLHTLSQKVAKLTRNLKRIAEDA